MGQGRRILFAGAVVLALIVLAAGWLLGSHEGGATTPATGVSPGTTNETTTARGPAVADAAVPQSLQPTADAAPPADSASAAEPGAPVTFTGRVIDEAGRPVADAEVVHLPTDALRTAAGWERDKRSWLLPWEKFPRTRTDAQGRFALPTRELPASPAALVHFELGNMMADPGLGGHLPQLLVMHAGFEPALFHVHAFARGAAGAGDLVVRLGGAISGRLLDADGQPVAGASVHVSSGDPIDPEPPQWNDLGDLPRTTSDAAGRFVLAGLWVGTFKAEIVAEGFIPERPQVTLRAGATTELGDVVLDRGRVIAGWVLATTGEPLAGARVTLRPANYIGINDDPDAGRQADEALAMYGGDSYELRLTTAADGSFRATGVGTRRSEVWHVIAAADDREPVLLRDVRAGAEDVRLELPPAAVIRLRVVEASGGGPVAGCAVQARRPLLNSPWRDSALPLPCTAQGDVWRIVGAGPLRNQAVVSAPGHATTGFELPGVELGQVLERTVELPRESVCAGVVVSDGGTPVPGARVSVKPAGEVPVRLDAASTKSDAQGRFELRGLAPGRWLLRAQAFGHVSSDAATISLAADAGLTDVRLVLVRGGRIAGHVVARDPRTLPGREVRAAATDLSLGERIAQDLLFEDQFTFDDAGGLSSMEFKGVVNDLGEYAIDGLPAGAYRVSCPPGDEAMVQVEAGAETPLDLALRTAPRVQGRVLAGGAPVRDATVSVTIPGAHWDDGEVLTATNAAGEYELTLDGVAQGLEICAQALGTKTRNVALHPQFDAIERVDLVFGGGALEGSVVDEQGRPVPAQLQWHSTHRPGFSEEDEVRVKDVADENGRFRLELLPDGPGELSVDDDLHVRQVLDDLVVRDGEATAVSVVLRAGGTVEVHLGDAAGEAAGQWLIQVHSLGESSWDSPMAVLRPGETETLKGIPAGAAEVEVRRYSQEDGYRPVRTVPIVVIAGQTTRFDQPATE